MRIGFVPDTENDNEVLYALETGLAAVDETNEEESYEPPVYVCIQLGPWKAEWRLHR